MVETVEGRRHAFGSMWAFGGRTFGDRAFTDTGSIAPELDSKPPLILRRRVSFGAATIDRRARSIRDRRLNDETPFLIRRTLDQRTNANASHPTVARDFGPVDLLFECSP